MFHKLKITESDGTKVVLTAPYYDKPEVTHSVTVSPAQWLAWQASYPLQDAAPELSADDREFLISGMSPAGFDAATAEDPYDDIRVDLGYIRKQLQWISSGRAGAVDAAQRALDALDRVQRITNKEVTP